MHIHSSSFKGGIIGNGPTDSWAHKILWQNVVSALHSLPLYFHSDTSVGDWRDLNDDSFISILSATIENQAVETLNTTKSVWDPDNKYGTYLISESSQKKSFLNVLSVLESHYAELA